MKLIINYFIEFIKSFLFVLFFTPHFNIIMKILIMWIETAASSHGDSSLPAVYLFLIITSCSSYTHSWGFRTKRPDPDSNLYRLSSLTSVSAILYSLSTPGSVIDKTESCPPSYQR